MHVDLENYLLSAKETLSEKMISNYLRDLFSEEIEEERKILIEGGEVPAEKTISVEPLVKTEAQEPEKIPKPYVGLEKIEPLKKERIFTFVREALQRSDVRMGVGIILILLILGVVISSYLLKEKTPTTTVTTTPSERRETSSPAIAPAPPKPDAKTTPSVPAQEPSVPKTEKEASVKEREPKTSTPLTDLISHGPQLLQENRHIEVLEQIDKLSDKERQNINVKVLESFAYLRKWIYQKDKISKTHWGNLYKVLESSGDRGATRLLMRIAKDPEEWTRLYAVSLLGSIGDQRALKDLQRISDSDPNWRIRRNARKAISLIQNRP